MFNWIHSFNKSKDNSVFQYNEQSVDFHRLEVNRQELIDLRFQTSGLDFKTTIASKKKSHSAFSGSHLSPFKGRGMDFDEVRPYQPGDDIRNIDWNVTARSNKVHTKVFKEEKERPAFIIIDFRSSMQFATKGSLKSVQAARLAVLSAWILADHQHRIGAIIFTDDGFIECPAKAGKKGVLRLINQLALTHQQLTQPSLTKKKFDSSSFFKRIKKQIKPGSLLLLISDLDFIGQQTEKSTGKSTEKNTEKDEAFLHLEYLSRHNDLLVTFIYDPLEVELPPPGQYAITSNDQDEQTIAIDDFTILDTSDITYRQSYRQKFIQRDAIFNKKLQQMGGHFLRLATNDNVLNVLKQLLGKNPKVSRIAKHQH